MLTSTTPDQRALPTRLERDDLIHAFRLMYTSRRIDDREILLKRQNKIFFQNQGAGHEAIQVAAGLALRPGHDWFYPYYRDRALALALGVTPYEMMLQAVGAASDTASGGRQMPSHWGSRQLHIVAGSSPTGRITARPWDAPKPIATWAATDVVTLVSSGEGATSEGEFWEAINVARASNHCAVIFLVEDNGYAISVPVEQQTAGGSISETGVRASRTLKSIEVDGTDFLASYHAMQQAVQYCRRAADPALVHAHCIRPYSHSLSDDEKLYKTQAERDAEAQRDPLALFPDVADRAAASWTAMRSTDSRRRSTSEVHEGASSAR